jgi:hypothetical protein
MTFLSGSGGAMSFDSGSGSTDALYLSMGQNSRYFNGQIGHAWVFDEALSTDDLTTLSEATITYYV